MQSKSADTVCFGGTKTEDGEEANFCEIQGQEHLSTASKALKEERIEGKNEHWERYQQLH